MSQGSTARVGAGEMPPLEHCRTLSQAIEQVSEQRKNNPALGALSEHLIRRGVEKVIWIMSISSTLWQTLPLWAEKQTVMCR